MKPRLTVAAAILAAALFAPTGQVSAQDTRAGWTTFASGDEVLAAAIDPSDSNTLWVGTEAGGLVRWNLSARSFTQHLFPTQNGLDSNQVRDIAFDPAGVPWLATARGVTYAGGSWRAFHQADGLPTEDITAIAVSSSGTVWAGTRRHGIAELAPGTDTWIVHEFDEAALGPGANRVADVAVAADDSVWVAHGRASTGAQPALSVYTPGSGEWRHDSAATPGGSEPGPPTDQLMSLAFDDSGTLWVGSWARGVLAFDGSQWTQHDDISMCGDKVWAVAAAATSVWAACGDVSGGEGVSHYDGQSWTTWTTDNGLPTDTVTAIAAIGGEAYLGTNGPGDFGSGVVPVGQLIGEVLTTSPATLPVNDVTALTFDDSGRLWVGTRGAGLMVNEGGRWERYTRSSTAGGLAGDLVTGLAWYEGKLWIATTRSVYQGGAGYLDGGASAYDPAADSWLTLTASTSDLPSNEVSSVSVADNGLVWFGLGLARGQPGDDVGTVHSGDGVAAYDPVTNMFVEAYTYDTTSGGLAGNTVTGVATAADGLWAATAYHVDAAQRRRGGGVSRFAGGVWTAWGGDDAGFVTFHGSGVATDPDPFITGDVRSVAVSPDGTVWAGTWYLEGGGALSHIWPFVDAVVNRFDGTMWEATSWMGSGWVSALAADGAGRLWAGTSRGHDRREFDPTGGAPLDTAVGGVRLYQSAQWLELTPLTSGLASTAITAITVNPSTGAVWFGFENEGLSAYGSGVVPPTVTPGGPTETPRPPATPTRQTVSTVAPTAVGGATATTPSGGGGGTPARTPTPEPPKEIPEPATVLLMGAGLAGLAALRRRRASGAGQGSSGDSNGLD